MEDSKSALERVLSRITQSVPTPQLRDGLIKRLTREYTTPPVRALELVLRRGISDDAARALLFSPSLDERGLGAYPPLLLPPPQDAPPTHPARALQGPFLLLVALHTSESWGAASCFIAAGGLGALAFSLRPSVRDLSARALALDALHALSSRDDYDWFSRPSAADDDRRVHGAMLALGSSTTFLGDLLAQRHNSFPGSSRASLELLAFWLSWARALHSRDGELRLSRTLLAGLEEWAARPIREDDSAPGEEEVGGGPGLPATVLSTNGVQEAELAKKLYADFSRFPCAPDPPRDGSGDGGAASAIGGLKTSSFNDFPLKSSGVAGECGSAAASSVSVEDGSAAGEVAPVTAATPLESAKDCKEEGNASFRGERWDEASRAYGQGIAALRDAHAVSDGDVAELNSLRVALHANRALSRLRAAGYGSEIAPRPDFLKIIETVRAQVFSDGVASGAKRPTTGEEEERFWETALARGSGSGDSEEGAATLPRPLTLVLGALSDATCALSLEPDHAKAMFRHAQALLSLGRWDEAAARARTMLDLARARVAALPSSATATERKSAADLVTQSALLVTNAVAFASLPAAASPSPTAPGGATSFAPVADQDDDEAAILAALLNRADFGGVPKEPDALPVREPPVSVSVTPSTVASSAGDAEGRAAGEVDSKMGGGGGVPYTGTLNNMVAAVKIAPANPAPTQQRSSLDAILSGSVRSKESQPAKKTFKLPG